MGGDIFKYGCDFVAATLVNRQIKVSEPSELNDPFELSPRIDATKVTVEQAMRFLRLDSELKDQTSSIGEMRG